jgi:hypothetical protein
VAALTPGARVRLHPVETIGDDWLAEYAALPWPEAVALARERGRTVRVVRPGTAVTRDLRIDRLNVELDEHDVLVRMSAG